MKEHFVEACRTYFHKLLDISPRILMALLVFAAFATLGYYLRRQFHRRILKKLESSIVASFFAEILFWALVIVGIVMAAKILGFTGFASTILAGAGVSAIVFGFAFKDILENFLAGFLLAIQKPFQVGDIIEVANYKGPVEALELRSTRMRLADGRDIWIPNALMVKGILTNYTRDGLIREEFLISIDINSNVEQARNLILDFLTVSTDVLNRPLPNVLINDIKPGNANLKVLFWINQSRSTVISQPEARGESIKSSVMRHVKDILIQNGYNLGTSLIVEHKMKDPREPISVFLEHS